MSYLAWQRAEWLRWWAPAGGPPQSALLAGPQGIGKHQFALALAQRLLCENERRPEEIACGQCHSCHLFATGNHPDIHTILPASEQEEGAEGVNENTEKSDNADKADKTEKKKSERILIIQIRALENFVYTRGYRGGRRVVLIEPAEAMNIAAANALLKILEEPLPAIHFILISHRIRRLLPTLRSRCRSIIFRRPETSQAAAWLAEQTPTKQASEQLALCGGAPLIALEEIQSERAQLHADLVSSLLQPTNDFLALSSQWESQIKGGNGLKMSEFIALVQKTLHDLLSYKAARRLRFMPTRAKEVAILAGRVNLNNLLKFQQELLQFQAYSSHPLNPRLFLDDLAARYIKAVAPTRR